MTPESLILARHRIAVSRENLREGDYGDFVTVSDEEAAEIRMGVAQFIAECEKKLEEMAGDQPAQT